MRTMSRREFIKLTGTTVACTCLGLVGTTGCAARRTSNVPAAPPGSYRVEGDRVIVALSEVESLRGVGGAAKLALGAGDASEPRLIVVQVGEEDYVAFADRCTHNGKELDYLHEEGKLACIGRGSQFDLAGNVIRGPAEDALSRYRLRREGEELVIEV